MRFPDGLEGLAPVFHLLHLLLLHCADFLMLQVMNEAVLQGLHEAAVPPSGTADAAAFEPPMRGSLSISHTSTLPHSQGIQLGASTRTALAGATGLDGLDSPNGQYLPDLVQLLHEVVGEPSGDSAAFARAGGAGASIAPVAR